MPLSSTTPRSLVDQAIDGMRELLASGEWAVGARIPPEPELARALDVSRNTVREAVRALAHTGVLQVRRGDGTYVAAPNEVAALLRQQLGRRDLGHVLEVRHAIETYAAMLAAERRTRADLTTLRRALAERTRAVKRGDAAGFVAADVAFHLRVVAAAHNPLLDDLYGGFEESLRTTILLPESGNDDLHDQHSDLLAAIEAQDPEAATRASTRLLDAVGH